MASSTLTPNMNLVVPVVGVELAPTWAQDLNVSLSTIDSHNHSSGSGVQITPAGLNINAALTFNSNAATSLGIVGFSAQGTGVATPVNDSVYVSGVDLYFQDGNGNAVRMTSGGSVNATSSGISSGTATASFVSSVLVVDQATSTPGPIDAATYILRYNGSYPSPSGNYILLAAPSSLSGGYQLTLPAAAPASSNAFLVENTSGALSYVNVDNSTLAISTGVLAVPSGGITATQIASGTITGTQVASNINLPGSAVQENGKNVVVSNTNATKSLSVIRGYINFNGSIFSGEGFTCTHNSTGSWTINFSSSFADDPAVTVNAQNNVTALIMSVTSIGTSSCNVSAWNPAASALTDTAFTVVIIGQRS